MRIPLIRPEKRSTAKYDISIMLEAIRHAVMSCPRLCITPPAILTPTMLKSFVRYSPYMTRRLSIPPAKEYSIPKTPEKSRPEATMRTQFIVKAYLKPIL